MYCTQFVSKLLGCFHKQCLKVSSSFLFLSFIFAGSRSTNIQKVRRSTSTDQTLVALGNSIWRWAMPAMFQTLFAVVRIQMERTHFSICITFTYIFFCKREGKHSHTIETWNMFIYTSSNNNKRRCCPITITISIYENLRHFIDYVNIHSIHFISFDSAQWNFKHLEHIGKNIPYLQRF